MDIIVAAVALFLSDITEKAYFDAIISLIIGLILMTFAVFLSKENKELLIGKLISKRDYRKISDTLSVIPKVNKIISIRSIYLTSEDILIAIEVYLVDKLDTDTIESVIDNIENKVRKIIPMLILPRYM